MSKPGREEIARREIGVTLISKGWSQLLSLFFLITVFLVPITQLLIDGGRGLELSFASVSSEENGAWTARFARANRGVLKTIDLLERDLEDKSFLRSALLPPLQYLLTKYLGQGNEKVVPGRGGQLFYRPAVDTLIGPPFLDKDRQQLRAQGNEVWEEPVQPDPVRAIRRFGAELGSQNIGLVLLPVPVKAAIRPAPLLLKKVNAPLANRSWDDFVKQLQETGLEVFDIRRQLYDYEISPGDAYLATDTHWSPAAMEMVADRLGDFLMERYEGLSGNVGYRFHQFEESGKGDLHRMLRLAEGNSLFSSETVTIRQVLTPAGTFWQSDRKSPVLLLGDSFTNIYSSPGLGLGSGGGFAEHLSSRLQRPVDLLARNDDGAFSSREMLASELRHGRDRLAGKRVVVWEFSERELSLGDWKDIDMTPGNPQPSEFFSLAPGERAEVQAVVAEISRSPRPGTIPYRDNIITIHVVDLQGDKVTESKNQALVYGFGMRDNTMTPLASLRPGDRVSLTLLSWVEKETEYGSYRRTSLDDEMTELELPNWGVLNDN